MRIYLFILFGAIQFLSGQATKQWHINELANVTAYIIQKTSASSFVGGTATLILHERKYYLLTAAHIAKRMKSDAKIIVRNTGDEPLIFDMNFWSRSPDFNWQYHPEADLAILRLRHLRFNRSRKNRISLLGKWFLPSGLITEGTEAPKRNSNAFYLGYPELNTDLKRFSPLQFSSRIASGMVTASRFDTGQKGAFFYLADPSLKGCSGAVVYQGMDLTQGEVKGRVAIVGMIHGTAGTSEGTRLAAVTPSFYIWELLNKE